VATCFLLHKYHRIEEKTIHSTNANSLTNTSKSYIDQEINKKKSRNKKKIIKQKVINKD
jgi:hypothetical protein